MKKINRTVIENIVTMQGISKDAALDIVIGLIDDMRNIATFEDDDGSSNLLSKDDFSNFFKLRNLWMKTTALNDDLFGEFCLENL